MIGQWILTFVEALAHISRSGDRDACVPRYFPQRCAWIRRQEFRGTSPSISGTDRPGPSVASKPGTQLRNFLSCTPSQFADGLVRYSCNQRYRPI
jgi:hypothetical protein